MRPPLRGAVVRGARQHAPRRLMGGASSAFLAARGARGGSSCYCCSACAECSGLGCRTAAAALRVAGGAGCVTIRRLTISNTTANMCNMYAETLRSIIAFRTRGTLHTNKIKKKNKSIQLLHFFLSLFCPRGLMYRYIYIPECVWCVVCTRVACSLSAPCCVQRTKFNQSACVYHISQIVDRRSLFIDH